MNNNFDEAQLQHAFREVQVNMAIEGIDLPDDAYPLLKKRLLGEISEAEFHAAVMEAAGQ